MDEEYVQEHILTGGIVAPVGRLIHGRLQPFRLALSRHTRHICGVLRAPRSAHAWSALRMVAR